MKQPLVCVCFTNNLFIIAKCAYATPDPVQRECSSSVYTLFILFILSMPCSISPTNIIFQSYLYFCQVTVNVLPSKVLLCTYATPDPVQPDQHYLRIHCIYPLCLFTHVPCISPANVTLLSYLNILPSYCQCPPPTAELPALTL